MLILTSFYEVIFEFLFRIFQWGKKLMIMNNQTELKKAENSQNHVLDKVSIS